MGYTKHHVIVVCGMKEGVQEAHSTAVELFDFLVSGIICSRMNGHYSFFIAPDGSIESQEMSVEFNKLRERFENVCDYIRKYRSAPLDIVEIKFGGDDKDNHELRIL